jgi:branched-chain amino acid transport system substrate-binding protein
MKQRRSGLETGWPRPASKETTIATSLARCTRVLLPALATLFASAAFAQQEVVKIAYIDPLSGPFANVGDGGLKQFQFVADQINATKAAGRFKLEVVGYDNKGTPQETLTVLKSVIDSGFHFVTQGNGSGAGLALQDAVQKHNDREPARAVVYFNYAAVDPDATNSKCSFWHFRFDANSEMKLEGLTDFIKNQPEVKKVYLINQNYSHGQQVSRAAKEYLKRKRPDIEVVGDDLHPLGQVKDFAPYAAKIKASGADTVITGNWGNDMSLLIKSVKDTGAKVTFYTFYAGGLGSPTAIGEGGVGAVKQITQWHTSVVPNKLSKEMIDFHKKNPQYDYYYLQVHNELYMLAEALKKANSDDPLKVAYALEGMKWDSPTGEVEMRASDHQLLAPLYISTIQKTAAKGGPKEVVYDLENQGIGFLTDARVESYVSAQPTTCQMKRPART